MASHKHRGGRIAIAAIVCLLALAVVPAQAVQELSGITPDRSVLSVPGKMAVGTDGTIYVVDGSKKQIAKFSSSGQYLGNVKMAGASAVAIASNGTLYAGSNQSYAVAIIKSGRVSGYLGKSANEFLSVRDIALDPASGRVYVADAAANEVKIFSSSGRSLGKIASLHQPVSVAAANNRIYVLDTPEIPDPISPTPTVTTGTRISVFNTSYSLLSTIDHTGDFGATFRPTDILVSASGTIYVSDIDAGSVLLFNGSGSSLGEILNVTPGFSPASISFSPDGTLLYVSSRGTRTIHRFSLAGVQ